AMSVRHLFDFSQEPLYRLRPQTLSEISCLRDPAYELREFRGAAMSIRKTASGRVWMPVWIPLTRAMWRLVSASVFVTACNGGSDSAPTTTVVPSPQLTTVSVSLSAAHIPRRPTATAVTAAPAP